MLKSFFPPFMVAFGIAVFVLMMQNLWVWLDEIVGKGVGIFVITEMVGYMSVTMFPMALPIGVLLSSVMVMGNLSEKYELVSFKSAGVSLSRVMRPLIICCTLIAIFSFISANNLIPYSNLKFRSRLHDISKSKPTLSLQKGVFNYDFEGMVMHVGDKDSDKNTIEEVVIYDHSSGKRGDINQIIAANGTMKPTKDNQFLVMHLENGTHYQETKTNSNRKDYPLVRTSFKTWEKVFDMREFDMQRTNEDLFKNNEIMMSGAQISRAIDSLDIQLADRRFQVEKAVADYYTIFKDVKIIQDSTKVKVKRDSTIADQKKVNKLVRIDSLKNFKPSITQVKKKSSKASEEKLAVTKTKYEDFHFQEVFDSLRVYQKQTKLQNVKTRLTTLQGRLNNRGNSLAFTMKSKTRHIYQLHLKYSNALVCLIFLFIGAPMGAIVRKGGFGYPVLIAIVFFMVYVVMTLTFKKLCYSYVVTPFVGAWLPCLLMIPIGAVLTYRALHDKKIGDISQYTAQLKGFFNRLFKRKSTEPV